MSMSNGTENSIAALYFNATAWADIAENDASSPLLQTRQSAHTSDPGEAGNQTTNEAAYGSYARMLLDRDPDGWTVSGNAANLTALSSWAQASSGTATLTHFGIGTATSGTGRLDFSGTITPNISVATGVTPQLTTSTAVTFD